MLKCHLTRDLFFFYYKHILSRISEAATILEMKKKPLAERGDTCRQQSILHWQKPSQAALFFMMARFRNEGEMNVLNLLCAATAGVAIFII